MSVLQRPWARLTNQRRAIAIALVAAAMLLLVPPLGGRARAQSPSDVQATIVQEGAGFGPCLLSIAAREDPWMDPHIYNLEGSGAQGVFQFMQGTWQSTPVGQAVPLEVASVAEQVQAAVYLLMAGGQSAWAPVPAACG